MSRLMIALAATLMFSLSAHAGDEELCLRYDYIYWRDDRQSTFDRSPNPEHWLWFQYEAKF